MIKRVNYEVIVDDISFLKSSKRFDFLGDLIEREETHKKDIDFYTKVFHNKLPENIYEKIKHVKDVSEISTTTVVHDYTDSFRYTFFGYHCEDLEYQLAQHLAVKYGLI